MGWVRECVCACVCAACRVSARLAATEHVRISRRPACSTCDIRRRHCNEQGEQHATTLVARCGWRWRCSLSCFGQLSEHFDYFKLLVIRGFLEARKHAHSCLLLLEVLSKQSRMACWSAGIDATLLALRDRFKLDATEEECVEHAYAIVEASTHCWRTVQYDRYQRITNGIM
jgi:hypothetical protein